jgi:hypothetical protein
VRNMEISGECMVDCGESGIGFGLSVGTQLGVGHLYGFYFILLILLRWCMQ